MLWVTKAVKTFDPLSVLSELGCQALKIRGCKSAHVSRKPALCKEIYQKEKQLQWRFIGTFCAGSSHLFFAKRLTPPFGFLLSVTVSSPAEKCTFGSGCSLATSQRSSTVPPPAKGSTGCDISPHCSIC
ncbi:hypothetical protein KIL84_016969 [Mauremys mutica]|uniref:Uncharacterized protein n=1 Tax=Mauremys mutica TaxID=74926 RepID=A0A9D4AY85_9SAUR|nr:hypothetical protein KIL84_016969 [Mauremys mutica]